MACFRKWEWGQGKKLLLETTCTVRSLVWCLQLSHSQTPGIRDEISCCLAMFSISLGDTVNREIFRYINFSLKKIFFVLKIFCRVDVLRKIYNITFVITQLAFTRHIHVRRGKLEQGEETYGESNCHGRVFRKKLLYMYLRLPRILAVGESLVCEREHENASNRYTVAVKEELLQDICLERYGQVCSPFLRRGGTIECTVSGRRNIQLTWHKADLKFPALYFSRQRLWNLQFQGAHSLAYSSF